MLTDEFERILDNDASQEKKISGVKKESTDEWYKIEDPQTGERVYIKKISVTTSSRIDSDTRTNRQQFMDVTRSYQNDQKYWTSGISTKEGFSQHQMLHFLGCYEDDCQIHLRSKEEDQLIFKAATKAAAQETKRDSASIRQPFKNCTEKSRLMTHSLIALYRRGR